VSELSHSSDIAAQVYRLQRWRLILLSLSAAAFLIWISIDLWSPMVPGGKRAGEIVCAGAFLVWIGALAGMLSNRGGLLRHQIVRAVLNDELTLAHRRTALLAGYWLLLVALAIVYAWSSFQPLATRNVVAVLLGVAVAIPILYFVVLEHWSERDD